MIETFTNKVGETPSGSDINIHGYRFIGSPTKAPSIYIQAGMHGGEVTIWVIKKLFKYLENNSFKGVITIIPIANQASWYQRNYFSTNGKFDNHNGRDWNRSFSKSTKDSVGRRIAKKLLTIATESDFVIDLHTSRKSIPFSIATNKANLEYAKSSGLKYCYVPKSGNLSSSMNGQLDKLSVSNIAIECGSHDSYNKKNIDDSFSAVQKILASLGNINIATTTKRKSIPQYFYNEYTHYHADAGGFIHFLVEAGEEYKIGDTLYEITTPNDLSQKHIVKAKENGVIIKQSPTHIYWQGDEVLQTVSKDNLTSY